MPLLVLTPPPPPRPLPAPPFPFAANHGLVGMMCALELGPLSSGHGLWSAFDTVGVRLRDGVVDDTEQAPARAALAIRTDHRPTGESGRDIDQLPQVSV